MSKSSAPGLAAAPANARLRRYDAIASPLLVFLGCDVLVLLVVDLARLPLTPAEREAVRAATLAIYGGFLLDAAIRFALTDDRRRWLRQHALLLVVLAAPLALPFDKRLTTPISIGVRMAALFWGARHGLAALRALSRGRVFYYLALVSTFVTLLGASMTLALERGHAGTPITSYGDALWWSATQMTTINSGLDPVSGWGRLVAVGLRVYAAGFFSALTANLASFFVAHFQRRNPDASR